MQLEFYMYIVMYFYSWISICVPWFVWYVSILFIGQQIVLFSAPGF